MTLQNNPASATAKWTHFPESLGTVEFWQRDDGPVVQRVDGEWDAYLWDDDMGPHHTSATAEAGMAWIDESMEATDD